MSKTSSSSHYPSELWLTALLRLCAAAAGVIALFIFLFLGKESWPLVHKIGLARFFADPDWHPTEGQFGLVPMLNASLIAMLLSVLVATPIGILAAIFNHFYAPAWAARGLRGLLGLLAGIPSVVYGFWGLVVLVPLIADKHPPGPSLLAAVLILTVMILPTIALMADGALANVPRGYIVGAQALGIPRWALVRGVVLPAARSGLFTGVILETGRAIGETMAVLMVAGNIVQTPRSLYEPLRTLTANIALEMAYAMGDHRAALFVSGLLLLLAVFVLVVAAEWMDHETL